MLSTSVSALPVESIIPMFIARLQFFPIERMDAVGYRQKQGNKKLEFLAPSMPMGFDWFCPELLLCS
ncbi:MAG: hypothetical protein ACYYK0_00945 [Candidatus Eutrophobiaceae bacterium]